MTQNKWLVGTSLSVVLALVGCGSDDKKQPSAEKQTIELTFAAQLGSDAVQCGDNSTALVGTSQTAPNVKYMGIYISNLEVATESGDFVPVTLKAKNAVDTERNIGLLAFCGASLKNNTLEGEVSTAGDYSRVRFMIGVPKKHNHLDATKVTGILAKEIAMNWGWTAGYKHMRLDVEGWNIHLGSTGCSGKNEQSVCTNGNRPTYTLRNMDFKKDKIVFDYAKLVSNSDITKNTPKTPKGCMSFKTDPECNALFNHLGLDLNTGQCKNNDCDSQDWVSTERQ